MRASRHIAITLALAGLLIGRPGKVQTQGESESYDSLVRLYRAGNVRGATTRVGALLGNGLSGPAALREVEAWTHAQFQAGERRALEGSLLLLAESFFQAEDSSGLSDGFLSLTLSRRFADAIEMSHDALGKMYDGLKEVDSKPRPFLRSWYLVWESYSQGHGWLPMRGWPDYLRRGLERFPQDTELLLAMGSRFEMEWWFRPDNSQRREDGRADTNDNDLQSALKWLRLSVNGRPVLVEAQLRLARVQSLTDDPTGAAATLRSAESAASDPVMRYLHRLFLGDVYKRQGNSVEAASAFAEAAATVPIAQSARLAAARLAYAEGDRLAATRDVLRAFSTKDQGGDPWWWYTRGQWWAFDIYTTAAREMVRQ
jgi:hypothetical protein